MKTLLSLLLLGFLAVRTCTSQTCTTWDEADYDTDPNDLNSDNATPRGFRQATIPNPETARDSDYPCITVNAVNIIQYMEILIETTQNGGSSMICIEVDGIDEPSCGGGSVSFCDKVPSLTSRITFNCDSGCDQSEVAIYYRANLSRSDIDDEYWCADRPRDLPSGLITFVPPSDITPQSQFTESALSVKSLSLSVLVILTVLVMVAHHVFNL